VTNDYIIEKFNKEIRKQKCPIIATSYSSYDGEKVDSFKELVMECQHIPTSAFRSLVMFEDKSNIEVLQKFIIPKEQQNNILKCRWTDNTIHIEKRTNLNFLMGGDKSSFNYSVYGSEIMPNQIALPSQSFTTSRDLTLDDKVVTYEGPTNLSVDEKIFTTPTHTKVKAAIDSMLEHLGQQDVKLLSAVFYFKIDRSNDLYLLYATNIK